MLRGEQGNLTNALWYKGFNICYEVAKSVGMKFNGFEVLWDYCADLLNNNEGVE